MIPVNPILGQLEIFEVYEYLDGPRLFAAKNNIGTMYLVYWFDERENETGWLYLPVSETRLNELRRKTITLNAAFSMPETSYFKVYVNAYSGIGSIESAARDGVDSGFFPPEGYYIEYVDVVKKADEWSFETILRGIKTSAEALSQFIGRFRELVEDIMNNGGNESNHQRPIQLYPLGALPGSIKIKFGADNHSDAIKSLRIIDQLMRSNGQEEFLRQLEQHKINPLQFKDFLNSIKSNKLDVVIMPKMASDGDGVELSPELIDQCLEYLSRVNYVAIDSTKVPQADDIDKVLEIVAMINSGTPLVPENINGLTTERQIAYYTHAAHVLGLITRDKQLTAAGHFVNSRSDKKAKYEILADRFESTDFGWAWMTWAQVQYMTELDPETATNFLLSASNLSDVTAKRRASTLRKWLEILQPHHRRYNSE